MLGKNGIASRRSAWMAWAPVLVAFMAACNVQPGGGDGNGDGGNGETPPGQELPEDVVLEITVEGDGTVEQEPEGNVVTLTATAAEGWVFKEWTGSLQSTLNPTTVIADDDTEIGATFIIPPPPDQDQDGVPDAEDACPGFSDELDGDEDGVPDGCDTCLNDPANDVDDDGVCGDVDNCPTVENDRQLDTDRDRLGDLCDTCPNDALNDADKDGVCGDLDRCANTPSGQQPDANGCAASQRDTDNDGITDDKDTCANTATADRPVNAVGCGPSQRDTDGDGVNDATDFCPSTPTNLRPVDIQGCHPSERDDDGDGVNNGADQCPNTQTGLPVNAQGCHPSQLDTDGDGVTNDLDDCPNTPTGSTVNADGCALSELDSDDDGVSDEDDICPNTPDGATVDANGCAPSQVDTDGDGVPDAIDQCPNTPPADRPNVNAQGCGPSQLDADSDGVPDATDNCRTTANPTQTDGDGDLVGDACDDCPGTPPGTEVTTRGCPRPIRWRSTQKLIQGYPALPFGDLGTVYFTPETYSLSQAGALTSAELIPSAVQARQRHGGTAANTLDTTVEPGGAVEVYEVFNASGRTGETLTETVRIDTFTLSINGSVATWTFSINVTDTVPFGGGTDEFIYSYSGTQTGAVSTVGGQPTITWTSVQGQFDYVDTFGGMESKPLSNFYFLGTWTRLP